MILSLVLVSCAPAVLPEEEEEVVVPEKEKEAGCSCGEDRLAAKGLEDLNPPAPNLLEPEHFSLVVRFSA